MGCGLGVVGCEGGGLVGGRAFVELKAGVPTRVEPVENVLALGPPCSFR